MVRRFYEQIYVSRVKPISATTGAKRERKDTPKSPAALAKVNGTNWI
ncbi:hypothetical protein [Nitrosomonas sp. Is37]|nr:hypothetical protein [Nitrosomonas sp. Is37]